MDKTISPLRANLVALALAPLVAAGFFLPHAILWGSASLSSVFERLISPFLLVLAASIVFHELLHGIGMIFVGHVPLSEVEFGVKRLMVYAHCRLPVRASAYRFAAALPGVALGILPGLIGMTLGSAWLTVYGMLMCIAALGDLLILWLIRSVPADAQVLDHPSAPGCRVLLE